MPAGRFTNRILVSGAVLASSVAIIAGVTSGGGGPAPSGSANLWVDTSGGSCVRQPTAGSYVDAQACASIQAAVAASSNGDTVRVTSGSYGGQTITTNRSSPGVTVIGDSSNRPVVASLNPQGDWIELQNFDVTGSTTVEDVGILHPTNVTFRGVRWTAGSGTRVFWDGGNNISFIDGEIGPTDLTADGQEPMYFQGDNSPAGSFLNNLTIDGMYLHNNRETISSPHIEQVRLDSGINNVTIKNSKFENNTDDTSTIFWTDAIGTSTEPTNLTVENNFFGETDGGQNAIKTQDPNVTDCSNMRIAYNTSRASIFATVCSTFTNFKMVGNVGAKQSGFCPGASSAWRYNLWVNLLTGSSANCGTGDTTVFSMAAVDFTADSFHINTTSPAVTHGDPSDCPATDWDDQSRPLPVATTCDSGADEVNQ